MKQFNKIENLLEKIVDGVYRYTDGTSLLFTLNRNSKNEIQVHISKYEIIPQVELNFIKVREDKDNQFKFDLPLSYIHKFIIRNGGDKNYYALDDSKKLTDFEIDNVYNQLVNKVNDFHKFYPIFLPAILDDEMKTNKNKQKKKLKI
jgi:hypothetical protein